MQYAMCGCMSSTNKGGNDGELSFNGIHYGTQADFDGGQSVIYNDHLLEAFGITRTYLKFFKMCAHTRKNRKPLLLILIENPEDGHGVDFLI